MDLPKYTHALSVTTTLDRRITATSDSDIKPIMVAFLTVRNTLHPRLYALLSGKISLLLSPIVEDSAILQKSARAYIYTYFSNARFMQNKSNKAIKIDGVFTFCNGIFTLCKRKIQKTQMRASFTKIKCLTYVLRDSIIIV